jgi:HD superfamily phosphodiesterase
MLIPFNSIFNYILITCKNHNIDESHGIMHSMDVLNKAHNIIKNENAITKNVDKEIVYTSALLHDMCDKKYMTESDGIKNIKNFLHKDLNYDNNKIGVIEKIIGTMSYSKVKKYGYPNMGKYQLEYNIVREADLLAAYDIDRAITYNMTISNNDFETAFINSKLLYYERMSKHLEDDLFTFDYTKSEGKKLNDICLQKIKDYNKILQ